MPPDDDGRALVGSQERGRDAESAAITTPSLSQPTVRPADVAALSDRADVLKQTANVALYSSGVKTGIEIGRQFGLRAGYVTQVHDSICDDPELADLAVRSTERWQRELAAIQWRRFINNAADTPADLRTVVQQAALKLGRGPA